MTDKPVVQQQVMNDGPLMQWVRDNAKTPPEPERHWRHAAHLVIWIVTKTYITKRCAAAMLNPTSSSVELGVSASAEGIFTLDPAASWATSTTGSSADIHEDPDDVVVFMSGVYYKKRIFGSNVDEAGKADAHLAQRRRPSRVGWF